MRENGYANEDLFQAAAFQWTWNTFPELRRLFFHPPNEGEKNIIKAKQDQAKGLVAGVSDFIFLEPRFCIELKQPGKYQSKEQKKFQAAVEAIGIPYYLIYYMEDFQATVYKEVNPVKWW